jgi:hypothetical protein
MSDFSVTEAFLNGWAAQKAGLHLQENPYGGYASTRQLYSASQWALGHCSRCEAVQLGSELTYDNVV